MNERPAPDLTRLHKLHEVRRVDLATGLTRVGLGAVRRPDRKPLAPPTRLMLRSSVFESPRPE